jgi:hypothetical protein
MSETLTQIQARPQYIQDIDEALLARIFGTPDESGVLTGGLIDRPDLFNIPEYVQAGSPLQEAVAQTFATPEQRQAFIDRYQPYFTDDTGTVRYLPEAGAGLASGEADISSAITDYLPSAKTYLQQGRGAVDAKSIYDKQLADAKSRADLATGTFGAKGRASDLFGGARKAISGGLGAVDTGGEFGAREAFQRGTGRAFELAEEGLGRFDPSARVQEFMDPYKEQVIDAAMQKIAREGAKARQGEAARAVGAGAFGGARAGIQIAESQRAQEEARTNTIANLMSKGYDQAMASAIATDEAARKRALQASGLTGELGTRGSTLEQQAFEDAAKRGLAGAQDTMRRQLAGGQALADISKTQLATEASSFEAQQQRMAKAADMYRSMGLSTADAQVKAQEDEMKRSLEAGRLMGGLGQTYGALGGAKADIGKAYGALAGTSADIGRVYAGMQPADLGFMYELGGKQRQYGQQGEDFRRQNILLKTQQALAPYSYGQTFLTGSPSASMYGQFTQQPSSAPNPFISGVGAYAGLQGLYQQS